MGFLTSTFLVFVLGQDSHPAKAELILPSAVESAEAPVWVGVKLTMEPEWHVYWKNPGDSGVAPGVDWTLPAGAKIDGPYFQAPERIETEYETTFGFEGETVLLYRLTLPKGHLGAVSVEADVNWMVCKEACLMGSSELSGRFLVGRAGDGRDPLKSWVEQLPAGYPKHLTVAFPSDEVIALVASTKGTSLEGVEEIEFFPADEGMFDHKRPAIRKVGPAIRFDLKRSEYLNGDIERVRGLLVGTKVDKNGKKMYFAVNIDVPVS